MALSAILLEQKFYSQIRNGNNFNQNLTDFTTYLNGNVGEKIKSISSYRVQWSTAPKEYYEITLVADTILNPNGDFLADGFTLGDSFSLDMTNALGTNVQFSANITFIDANTIIHDGGSQPTLAAANSGSMWGTTNLDGVLFKYNLIENNANVSYNSLINNELQAFYGSNFQGTSVPLQILNPNTQQTWMNGEVNFQGNGMGTGLYYQYHYFTCEHEFIILPQYLTGYDVNINNNTLPTLFSGTNTLKYIQEVQFRKNLGDINSAKILSNTDRLGNVGFYGENLNGYTSNYQINSISYNGQTALNAFGNTSVTIKLANTAGLNIVNGQEYSIGIIRALDSNNYNGSLKYENDFLYDSGTQTIGAASSSYTIIKNVTSTVASGIATIDFEIEYTAAQSNLIQSGENYILWVGIGDSGLSNGTDNRVNLIADFKEYEYSSDIDGLLEIDYASNFGLYNHVNQIGNAVNIFDSFNGFVEDGYVYKFNLRSRAEFGVLINQLEFQIGAYNEETEDYFSIQNFNFNLSSSTNVPTGTSYTQQNLNLNSTRGFDLAANDQFNYAKINTIGTNLGWTTYEIEIGFKFNWESWISNPNVNNVFFDNTKPNDNKNLLTSNYSEFQDYSIYANLNASVTNEPFQLTPTSPTTDASQTAYKFYFPKGIVRYYGDDSIPKGGTQIIDCNIDTYDEFETFNTSGNILDNEKTKIIARFERVDGQLLNLTNVSGCIRIDIANGSLFSIQELSTLAFNVPLNNSLLIPLNGETRTKIVTDPNGYYIELQCLVDNSLVIDGNEYTITARLWENNQVEVGNKIMEDTTQKEMENSTDKIIE